MNLFINEFKLSGNHDKWGYAISWAFGLCDWLEDNTDCGCLAEWEFRQSICGSNMDDEAYQCINDLVDLEEEQNIEQLFYFEKVLFRYVEQLRKTEHYY